MELVRFMLLGIGTGGVYGMLAQGLVLVYRGSGVLNFSQGAIAMVGGFAYYECSSEAGLPLWVSLVVALVISGVLGAAIHLLILRYMQRSSSLSRVIATLGVMIALQAGAYIRYGYNPRPVKSLISARTVHIFSNKLGIGLNVLAVFVIGVVLTVALTIFYRRTLFGRVTTAVAEKQRVAASLGHSPDFVAAVNWGVGGVIAGLAGVLIAPILYLEPTQLVLLVLPAMSAALLCGFSSFPIAFGAAVALGIAQSLISRYVHQPGWSSAAPFIVVVLVLVLRGQLLPLRSHVLDKLPAVGSGRIRKPVVVLLYAAGAYLTLTADLDWATAMTNTLGLAIICMSIVVITGYAGQLSFAQSVIAGIGALLAAKAAGHVPFLVSVLIGAGVAGAVGAIVGLCAFRTRGVTLAIATLGISTAGVALVLTNTKYTNGLSGIQIPDPDVFGWDITPLFHSNRYAFVTLTIAVLIGIAIANLRRGVTGRRLLAVRSNERAAAALGLNGSALKAYAFVLAAALAGVGGVLLAFNGSAVSFNGATDNFSVFAGILVLAMTVAGGLGSVGGALIGSLMLAGGVVTQLFSGWSEANEYLPLIGGIALICTLIQGPDGLLEVNKRAFRKATNKLGLVGATRLPVPLRRRQASQPEPTGTVRIRESELVVRNLSVSFGGIHAVQDVDITVRPGEVHGLIGPNGAGKTTVIDAVTGFVKSRGSVALGSEDVSKFSARRRAKTGVSRSFQSLELFNDLTVRENLVVAGEGYRMLRCISDLLWPGRPKLSAASVQAIRQFELEDLLERKPDNISFGQRKAVAIARAIASSPSILLLDEPAAGLNDAEADELARLVRTIADEWRIGVLLVEHKVDMVRSISDRVSVLESGRLLATGRPDEVLGMQTVIDAYLGRADHDQQASEVHHANARGGMTTAVAGPIPNAR